MIYKNHFSRMNTEEMFRAYLESDEYLSQIVSNFIKYNFRIQAETLRVLILELSKKFSLPISSFSREERNSKKLTYAKIGREWDIYHDILSKTKYIVWDTSRTIANIHPIINRNAREWINKIRSGGHQLQCLSSIMSAFGGYIYTGTLTLYSDVIVIVLMTYSHRNPVRVCTITSIDDWIHVESPDLSYDISN